MEENELNDASLQSISVDDFLNTATAYSGDGAGPPGLAGTVVDFGASFGQPADDVGKFGNKVPLGDLEDTDQRQPIGDDRIGPVLSVETPLFEQGLSSHEPMAPLEDFRRPKSEVQIKERGSPNTTNDVEQIMEGDSDSEVGEGRVSSPEGEPLASRETKNPLTATSPRSLQDSPKKCHVDFSNFK